MDKSIVSVSKENSRKEGGFKCSADGSSDASITVLIGPEEGFTDVERELLIASQKTCAISLGDNVLRSEIAAIAALSCIQMLRS